MAARKVKKRGAGPAAAILLAGVICCWTGLVRVDRRIRAVTIYRSPPLWEVRAEGDIWVWTVLGKSASLDMGPVRQVGEELRLVWETPPAPVRVGMVAVEWLRQLE